MPDPSGEGDGSSGWAPIDYDVLDRLRRRLERSDRFEAVESRPRYAPDSLVLDYDSGYFPAAVDRAYLRVRWYENDDFTVHYSEQYEDGKTWDCRWDRHPNEHNTRGHVHPPPNAATPGIDVEYSVEWRDVVADVLGHLDERIQAFWR